MKRAICIGIVLGLSACDPAGRTLDVDDELEDESIDEDGPEAEPEPESEPEPLPTRAGLPLREGECEHPGESFACADGELRGVQFCDDYHLEWGPCLDEVNCEVGEVRAEDCGNGGVSELACVLTSGVPQWEECGFTPLVISFDGREPAFDEGPDAFELSAGSQACFAHQWPGADTPWLALDLDGNGAIDHGGELFGSASPMPGDRRAHDGFEALAVHDANGDRRITPADPIWSRLVLWSDHDRDRHSSPLELTPVESSSLSAIELDFTERRRCDASGNCGIERAPMSFTHAGNSTQGQVIDVHIPCD